MLARLGPLFALLTPPFKCQEFGIMGINIKVFRPFTFVGECA